MKRPNTRRNLDLAIQRTFKDNKEFLRARTLIANTIVGQMLPGCAMKGGSAIKMRLGDVGTRFTSDLDIALASDLEEFSSEFNEILDIGWNGFTGRLIARTPASPENVPRAYVMQPHEIKLDYNHKPWLTVLLEIGYNELGDADEPDWGISPDIVALFEQLGFPAPKPVALMPLHHQIAQKLHGLSEQGSNRAHDLIDLQLLLPGADFCLTDVRVTCEKLFAYRRQQTWPPILERGNDWGELYASQAEGLDVLQNVNEAILWANELVNRISTDKS